MTHPEPPQPAATPRRFAWRRLFQYRLRTLLIFTTLVAVWLAWWSHKVGQQRAAAAVFREANNAYVLYDFQESALIRPRYWPAWLVDRVGVDYFANVTYVHMVGPNVTDIGLEQVKGLSNLRTLLLPGTKVTDAGLEHLKGLTTLRELVLRNTKITDAGAERLQKALPNCKIER